MDGRTGFDCDFHFCFFFLLPFFPFSGLVRSEVPGVPDSVSWKCKYKGNGEIYTYSKVSLCRFDRQKGQAPSLFRTAFVR